MAGRGRGRLVIEPFRTTMQSDPDFATKTWKVLENAIAEIFNANASHLSFEALYRASYNMVLHRHAELLYSNMCATVRAHLGVQATHVAGRNDDEFLGALNEKWQAHKVAMQMIRDILMYLDRTYVEQNNKTTVYEAGLESFRDHVARHEHIKARLLNMMLDYIQSERDGELIDRQLARAIAGMYSDISQQLYQEDFEVPFLETSQQFYEKEAQQFLPACSCADYLKKVETRLEEEATRVSHYLYKSTGPKIRRKVQDTMILAHMEALVGMEQSGLVAMLRDDRLDDLSRMYRLFREVQGGAELIRREMSAYLVAHGTELVHEPAKQKEPLEYVRALLALRAKFKVITTKALCSHGEGGGAYDKVDKSFDSAVSDSFMEFMNKNQRTPEFLSIYLDRQLKSGLGGMAEDQADERLNEVMKLFCLLEDKDVFERYYKLHLAKRLLTKGTVSDDLEKAFVSKLKSECGNEFTSRMEAMFNDMRVSIDTNTDWREYSANSRDAAGDAARKDGGVDLSTHVLTTGCWPSLAAKQNPLPPELSGVAEMFSDFYLAKHNGRKLTWQTNMGTADLRCTLGGKTRELVVTTQQMLLLLQFNHNERLTFAQLLEACGIEEADAKRNLQSLACVKRQEILKKEPSGRDVAPDDVFTVNEKFSSKFTKIKVKTVTANKETADEVPLPPLSLLRLLRLTIFCATRQPSSFQPALTRRVTV